MYFMYYLHFRIMTYNSTKIFVYIYIYLFWVYKKKLIDPMNPKIEIKKPQGFSLIKN